VPVVPELAINQSVLSTALADIEPVRSTVLFSGHNMNDELAIASSGKTLGSGIK
jgi:hypothetical protein